jgi:hypothetical protein
MTSSRTSAEHLAELGDNYFSGDESQGLENPSFVRRDSGNTIYEEIPGYGPMEPGSPTFTTFAKTTHGHVSEPEFEYLTDEFSFTDGSPSPLGCRAGRFMTHVNSKQGTTHTTTAHVHTHGHPNPSGHAEYHVMHQEESSFSNPYNHVDHAQNSTLPVAEERKHSADDATYATISRPKRNGAVTRIAAIIEQQHAQRQ